MLRPPLLAAARTPGRDQGPPLWPLPGAWPPASSQRGILGVHSLTGPQLGGALPL